MMLFANRCDAVLYKTHRHDENISPGIPEPVVMLPEVTTLDRPNDLIITPSNRADIILGATTANYAGNFPARIDATAPKKIATALGSSTRTSMRG
ncbi:MAG: hypothetical protein IE886_06840 [Campylobacterales bacterium]|nr:hypothetical protein [Campylobacterales bacterium]